MLSRGPDRAQRFDRRNVLAGLAWFRPILAIERIARVGFDKTLLAAPLQKAIEAAVDVRALGVGAGNRLNHQANSGRVDRGEQHGVGVHDRAGEAGVADRLLARPFRGPTMGHQGAFVGVERLARRLWGRRPRAASAEAREAMASW